MHFLTLVETSLKLKYEQILKFFLILCNKIDRTDAYCKKSWKNLLKSFMHIERGEENVSS
jgi:hypothetical protein